MSARPRRARHAEEPATGHLQGPVGGERGMVTVELAVGLAVVVFALGAVAEAAGASAAHTRLCSQVRDAARAASIGQPLPPVGERELSVHRNGRWVMVSGKAATGGPSGTLGVHVNCELATLVERSVP